MCIRDREDFSGTFREFYKPLVRYARGITKDTAQAEDVVQDVFATLWEKRREMTVERSLKALLYTMVRNRALNTTRRENTVASDFEPEELDERRAGQPTADEQLEADALRQRLHRWIQDLAPRRKEAFMLSRFHDLTHREIAAIMDISKRTVDKHIGLALKELRRRLDELKNEDTSS